LDHDHAAELDHAKHQQEERRGHESELDGRSALSLWRTPAWERAPSSIDAAGFSIGAPENVGGVQRSGRSPRREARTRLQTGHGVFTQMIYRNSTRLWPVARAAQPTELLQIQTLSAEKQAKKTTIS